MTVTAPVVVRRCIGVTRQPVPADDSRAVHLVFGSSTGGLHIVAMDEVTAIAAMLAIRADVPADPDELAEAREREARNRALEATLDGMAVWDASRGADLTLVRAPFGKWEGAPFIDPVMADAAEEMEPDVRVLARLGRRWWAFDDFRTVITIGVVALTAGVVISLIIAAAAQLMGG